MTRSADRAAVNRLLGLVDDPEAHGSHAITARGRVRCGDRQYKWGYAPCQLYAPPCMHLRVLLFAAPGITGTDNASYRCDDCGYWVRPIRSGPGAATPGGYEDI